MPSSGGHEATTLTYIKYVNKPFKKQKLSINKDPHSLPHTGTSGDMPELLNLGGANTGRTLKMRQLNMISS